MTTIAKAIAAAVVAAGTGITTAAIDGGIAANEWWVILGGTLVAFGSTWYTPNRQP